MFSKNLRAGAALATLCVVLAACAKAEQRDNSHGQGGMTISGSGATVEQPDAAHKPSPASSPAP